MDYVQDYIEQQEIAQRRAVKEISDYVKANGGKLSIDVPWRGNHFTSLETANDKGDVFANGTDDEAWFTMALKYLYADEAVQIVQWLRGNIGEVTAEIANKINLSNGQTLHQFITDNCSECSFDSYFTATESGDLEYAIPLYVINESLRGVGIVQVAITPKC